jgi:glutathione S-transferase
MASTTSFLTLSLPTGYPFVLLAATSSVFLTTWQGILVGQARKASGLKYPYVYHDKAEATANPKANVMNCTQRAVSDSATITGLQFMLILLSLCSQHQNTLENVS